MPEDIDPENQPPVDPEPKPEPPKPTEPQKAEKTFTQEELNRINSQTKKDAKAAAVKELMEQLGIKDVDVAKGLIEEASQRKEAEKTELQRQMEAVERERQAAATSKAEAEAERNEAKRDRLNVKVERALLKAGLPAEKLERVAKTIDLDLEADDEAIAAEVEKAKEDLPESFAPPKSDDPAPAPGTPNSHLQGKPPATKLGNDPLEMGRQMARQRQGRDNPSA